MHKPDGGRYNFRLAGTYRDCDKKDGPGMNAPDADPETRYGNAGNGNREVQVLVNDKYD